MKNFQIEDAKEFLGDLMTNEKYDSFYLFEARIKSDLDYYVNGKRNMEYPRNEDERGARGAKESNGETGFHENESYICWKDIKDTLRLLMGEEQLPLSLKLILMFHRDNITRLIEMNNLPLAPEDVGALFYNVYLERGELSVTTGISLKVFTMDKTLEHLWDESVGKYYIA